MMRAKTKNLLLMSGLVLSLLFCQGCGNDVVANRPSGKLIVAVTIVPQKTFAQAVCGDLAEVVAMVPPGNSPANYEPTPAEMEAFSKAAVYFTVGVPTEEANILPGAGDVKVVSLEDEVSAAYPDRMLASGSRDPHIWLSPKRAKVMVSAIAREMCALDKANSETYLANAKAYNESLDRLDSEITEALNGLSCRKFIVYHPAFGYLADDYGLEMIALEEDGKEATAKHLREVIDLAKTEGIRAIFYQEEIDSSQSQAFAEEIGGKTVQLAPLSADYANNLLTMAKTMAEAMR